MGSTQIGIRYADQTSQPDIAGISQAVAQDTTGVIQQAIVIRQLLPSSVLQADITGSYTQWLSFGNIVVPSWAMYAMASWQIDAVFEVSAASNTYDSLINLGNRASASKRLPIVNGLGTAPRFIIKSQDYIGNLASGSKGLQPLTIQTARLAGAGAWRVDTLSEATIQIVFQSQ